MKTTTYVEQAAITHDTPYDDRALVVTWQELRNAEVGASWSVEDQNCYPNADEYWTVRYSVIYRNEGGVGVLRESTRSGEEPELFWFSFT